MQRLNQNISIVTLKSFSKWERRAFIQLINANYFKLDKKNLFFLKQLFKVNLDNIEAGTLINQLSQADSYSWSNGALRESLSKLNALFKEFIYLQESKLNKFNQSVILSEYYLKNNIPLHASTLTNTLKKKDGVSSYSSHSEYYILYQKLIIWDKINKGRKASDNFDKAHLHLNYAYWLEMLKLECEIKNRRDKVKNFEIPSILVGNDKFESFIKDYLWNDPLVRLYFLIYKLQNENDFQIIHKEWLDTLSIVSKENIKSISIYLLNYCIEQFSVGKVIYGRIYLQITKVLIQENLLLENGQILNSTYNNICSLAINENQIDWALNFIEDYKVFLLDNIQGNTYKLCKAKILFKKQKFEAASDLLLDVNLQKDFYFNVSVNILLIKCYVELNMDGVALNKINNLELSISRAKQSYTQSSFSDNSLKFLENLKLILRNKKTSKLDSREALESEWLNTIIQKKVSL